MSYLMYLQQKKTIVMTLLLHVLLNVSTAKKTIVMTLLLHVLLNVSTAKKTVLDCYDTSAATCQMNINQSNSIYLTIIKSDVNHKHSCMDDNITNKIKIETLIKDFKMTT